MSDDYAEGLYTYTPAPLRVRIKDGMVYKVLPDDSPTPLCRPIADCLADGTLTPIAEVTP